MGISRMQKVLLVVHRDEKDKLLETLQDKAIIHIKDIKESTLSKDYPEFIVEKEITDKEIEDRLLLLGRAIDYLKKFSAKGSLIDAFLPQKLTITEPIYKETISSNEPLKVAKKVETIEQRLDEIDREYGLLISQKEVLLPWQALDVEVEDISSTRLAISVAGVVNNPPDDWKDRVQKLPVDIEIVNEELVRVWVLISYLQDDEVDVKKLLAEIGFEAISFKGFKGKPANIIAELEEKLAQLDKERITLLEESESLVQQLNKILILHDYYSNLLSKTKIENLTLSTPSAVCIEGWIRAKDYKTLAEIIAQFEAVSVSKIAPEPGENLPVELENRRGISVFESITELYSSPNATELDPSPFLAPFFVLCFALCLTDAFYGLILAGICLLLMKRVKGDKRLLWVLFASGITTLFTGAITGGWFGDLGERFGLEGFVRFKDCLLVFNPMKTPLTFLLLSFAIGFIQVSFGYFLGFIKALREGKIFEGISTKLAWNIFWLAILIFGFSKVGTIHELPPQIISGSVAIIAVGIILFGSGGPSRNLLFRIAKGGLNLYQGLSGTLSDILSYSRLMALGLVTAGLAMTVNILVELVSKMPVIGIVLAPIAFVFGHLLSIGINVLGAFVHSLRLQYAEFFTKFFDGGGKAFKPFRKEAKYILVEKGD
ncbi:MAG: V-type ATP synthase subunit I [bacterium]|nr:V-type ATP synthase subunit I [bacterium]